MNHPGKILLLGSGETSPVGGKAFEQIVQSLPSPVVISILETPAGFELNSQKVAEKVGSFLQIRLQNSRPIIQIIPARKKGTPFSPDNPEVVKPLYGSGVLYMGAGSPTYAVRQLEGSLAWKIMRTRHARGAAVVLASAAIIAAGRKTLPVYEIFKVGQDPHWVEGLDFLGAYGLPLVFVPHWNNQEGGADLDTSRCFLGEERFNPLLAELPPEVRVVGLDEMTALRIDFSTQTCEVSGLGSLHLLAGNAEEQFSAGVIFPLSRLGDYHLPDGKPQGIPDEIWDEAEHIAASEQEPALERPVPGEISKLVTERQTARQARDWQRADEVRKQIEQAGWKVNDTPAGPQLEFVEEDY